MKRGEARMAKRFFDLKRLVDGPQSFWKSDQLSAISSRRVLGTQFAHRFSAASSSFRPSPASQDTTP
jgi:hypothetical protein